MCVKLSHVTSVSLKGFRHISNMSHVVEMLSCPVTSFAIDVQKGTSLKILVLNEMKKTALIMLLHIM